MTVARYVTICPCGSKSAPALHQTQHRSLTCFQNLEELAFGELGDEAELVRRLKRIEQHNNVWVVQPALNIYLLQTA